MQPTMLIDNVLHTQLCIVANQMITIQCHHFKHV